MKQKSQEKTNTIEQEPKYTKLKKPQLLNNWFCFFLLGHVVYFNENFHSAMAADYVGPSHTYMMVLFLHLPKFIFKVISVYFLHLFSQKARIWLFTGLSLTASLLTIFVYPTKVFHNQTETQQKLSIALGVAVATLGCVGMAIGEITFLALTNKYEKSCVNGWSSGTGAAGFSAGVLYLAYSVLMKKYIKKYSYSVMVSWAGIINFIVALSCPLVLFGIMGKPPKKRNNAGELKKGPGAESREAEGTGEKDKASKSKERTLGEAKAKKIHDSGIIYKMYVLYYKLALYSVPLTLGYVMYFVAFSGINPFVKDYNKKLSIASGTTESLFDVFVIGFLILRFFVFMFRSAPQFVEFYQVWMIPFGHGFSLICLTLSCFCGMNSYLILASLVPLGIVHGAVVGYSNLGIRNKAPEYLRDFGLSYINISSALGATLGNLLASPVKKVFTDRIKVK